MAAHRSKPRSDPDSTVAVEGLTFSYGSNRVLHGLSFALGKGEVVGLLGPNGAGKSTTIKVLTGILPPGRRIGSRRRLFHARRGRGGQETDRIRSRSRSAF